MKRINACIVWAGVTFLSPALGNGINPPRPSELALVQTTCHLDPAPGAPSSIFRSRLAGSRNADRLEFRVGKQGEPEESESLSMVERIAFRSRAVSTDGYAKATIALRNRPEPVEASVKVREGANQIVVAGFRENGQRVEVPLVKCVQLEFVVPGAESDAKRDVKKK